MEIDRRKKTIFCGGRGGGDCCQVPEAGFPRVSPLWSAVQGAALFSPQPPGIFPLFNISPSYFKRIIKDASNAPALLLSDFCVAGDLNIGRKSFVIWIRTPRPWPVDPIL
jgi:hypothetical protein